MQFIIIVAGALLTVPMTAFAPPRGTVGVASLHSRSVPSLGVDATARGGPVGVPFTYFRRTEVDAYKYDSDY